MAVVPSLFGLRNSVHSMASSCAFLKDQPQQALYLTEGRTKNRKVQLHVNPIGIWGLHSGGDWLKEAKRGVCRLKRRVAVVAFSLSVIASAVCFLVTGEAVAAEPLTAAPTASPSTGPAPLQVSFDGNAAGGVPPYHYFWEFGDRHEAEGQFPQNTYTTAGTYTVECVVSDCGGSFVVENITITVKMPGESGDGGGTGDDLGILGGGGNLPFAVLVMVLANAATVFVGLYILRKNRIFTEVGDNKKPTQTSDERGKAQ